MMSVSLVVLITAVFLGMAFLIYVINLKSSRLIYGVVGTSTMPDKDFHDLKLKISVLKHAKEIRESREMESKE